MRISGSKTLELIQLSGADITFEFPSVPGLDNAIQNNQITNNDVGRNTNSTIGNLNQRKDYCGI